MSGKLKLIFKSDKGFNSSSEATINLKQKPTRIYKKILHELGLTPKNILDTNSGSGTLALVCHDLDISFVGLEYEKDYHFDSVMRVRNHIKIPIIRFN